MGVVAQIYKQFAATAVRNVEMCHGCCATRIRHGFSRAARLVHCETPTSSAGAVQTELDDKVGAVETRAVVKFGLDNVAYVRDCLRSGFGEEMEGDGADNCIDDEEARHGCVLKIDENE